MRKPFGPNARIGNRIVIGIESRMHFPPFNQAGPRRAKAPARVGGAWLGWMVALPLVLMLGLAPRAAEARQIHYFDFHPRSLPLPDPPNLGPGPFGNQYFRETRDVAVLADGATSAKPIENWHLAVLRTFILSGPGEGTHTYLALINVETNRTLHIDLAESKGDFIHSRLATGGACMRQYVCLCVVGCLG